MAKLIENPAKGSNSPSRKGFDARISPPSVGRRGNRDEGEGSKGGATLLVVYAETQAPRWMIAKERNIERRGEGGGRSL